MTPNPVAERRIAIDKLDRAIVNLCARINASEYQLLALVREFDERAGWLKWGFDKSSDWLHWRCDISRNAARERIRIAHALKCLPVISRAFAGGKLSYSKVHALAARDGGCRFPGCRNTRYVDAHHVQHWAKGGDTSLKNLMLLCSRHHTLVHEGGYTVRTDYKGDWYFQRPDGRAVPDAGYHPDDMIDDERDVGHLAVRHLY